MSTEWRKEHGLILLNGQHRDIVLLQSRARARTEKWKSSVCSKSPHAWLSSLRVYYFRSIIFFTAGETFRAKRYGLFALEVCGTSAVILELEAGTDETVADVQLSATVDRKRMKWKKKGATDGQCVYPSSSVVAQPFLSLLLWRISSPQKPLQFTEETDRRQIFVV